jgi:hypothetical protein
VTIRVPEALIRTACDGGSKPAPSLTNSALTRIAITHRYQVCLFCLSRLKDEYGNRCPGCRTLYGTDREEWVRQSEARVLEAQSQQLQRSPRRSQNTAALVLEEPSSSRQQVAQQGTGDGMDVQARRPPIAKPVSPAPQPAPVRAQFEQQHWPSLAQHRSNDAKQAHGHLSMHRNHSTSSSTNLHLQHSSDQTRDTRYASPSRSSSQEPYSVSVPVTVQSLVNGHSTRVDTVLELRPPCPQEQEHFVPMDGGLEHLVSQFQKLSSAERSHQLQQSQGSASVKPRQSLPTNLHSRAQPLTSIPFPPPGISAVPSARVANGFSDPPYNDWPSKAGSADASTLLPPKPTLPFANEPTSEGDTVDSHASYHPLRSVSVFGTALLGSQAANPFDMSQPPPPLPLQQPNLLHRLFTDSGSSSHAQPSGWLTEPAPDSHDPWNINEPLVSLLPTDGNSYATRRVPLYERCASDTSQAVAPLASTRPPPPILPHTLVATGGPPGLDSSFSRDPVISPRRLAARAKPIGTAYGTDAPGSASCR